ncbi:MAG: hypothetical protein SangKO_070130 [Sandaracinaceae bacterium]
MKIEDFLGASTNHVFTSELASSLGPRKEQHHGDRSYAIYARGGVELSVDPALDIVKGVFIYPDRKRKPGFTGELPAGVTTSDTRDGLLAKLGEPDETLASRWDTWERAAYKLRAEYASDGNLKMFVLMG